MNKLTRFVLSNGNLAGCSAALVVVLLYLVGVIDQWWAALTALGYAAGFVAMWRPQPEGLPDGLSTVDSLRWLQDKALPRLTGEARDVLVRILMVAEELMPRLKELEAAGSVQAENRAMLKQTVTRYLPDILQNYLKLPPLYAKSARVVDGKTPYLLLAEQLKMLESHVQEIRQGLYSQQVDSLLANGRFLQEKLHRGVDLMH